jgi:hypothetical protein
VLVDYVEIGYFITLGVSITAVEIGYFITLGVSITPLGVSITADLHKPIQIAPRYVAANKNIMVGILLAEEALLKSPYVKR